MSDIQWTHAENYVAFGVHFGLRTNSAAAWKRLKLLLPPGTRTSRPRKGQTIFSLALAGKGSMFRIFRDAHCLAELPGENEQLLANLRSELHLWIAEISPDRFFIHAGTVSWNGRAILMPGRSDRGKSTLVRALVEAGAVFYSDEYAVLDMSGKVHPFPRPLQLRDRHGENLPPIRPEKLGATGQGAIPAGLVLLTEYRPCASWSPKKVSAGAAALKLLSHSVSVRRQPERLLKVVNRLTNSACVLESARGEATQVVEWLKSAWRPSGSR